VISVHTHVGLFVLSKHLKELLVIPVLYVLYRHHLLGLLLHCFEYRSHFSDEGFELIHLFSAGVESQGVWVLTDVESNPKSFKNHVVTRFGQLSKSVLDVPLRAS
jgi:hypothetical protein